MKKTLIALIIGLASGLITNLSLSIFNDLNLPYVIPGIVFGIFSLISFFVLIPNFSSENKIYKNVLWILISTIAFFVAYYASFYSAMITDMITVSGFLGGLVGSLLLSFGYMAIFKKLSKVDFLVFLLSGAFFGFLSFLFIVMFDLQLVHNTKNYPIASILYPIWQTMMIWVFQFINNKKNN